MEENIKDKTVRGLTWSAIDSFASQGVSFIVGIILARLLSPAEFGTIGVAMIFVSLFNKIVDCGFSSALIRKQDAKNIDYNTTFIFNLLLSIFLYFLSYISSPFISDFFNNDELLKVIRWISLVVLINAFAIIHRTHFVKNINFKTQAKISLIASISSGIIGITMAFYNCGVWSLVGQQLSRQMTNTVLLWVYDKWRPKLEFSLMSFKCLFSYGSKLLLSGIVDTLSAELSTIVIGKLYSSATLGQYSRSKQFVSIFSSNVSIIMERVTYPVLSKFQSNQEQLISYYKIIVKSLMLVTGLGLAIIGSSAESIILILLGDKWTDSILYLQLLVFVDVTIPVKNVNLNLLQVYGRSDYILKLSMIKRIIEFCAIALGFFSLVYMLIGFAIVGVIGLLLNARYTQKVSGYSVKNQLLDLMPSFTISLIVGAVMYICSLIIDDLYISLLVQIIVGLTVFFVIVETIRLKEYIFLKTTLLNILKR